MTVSRPMPLGPLMIDVVGPHLDDEDRRRLLHPLVGGVILFARNYEAPAQLARLTQEIHALRDPHLLIAVDHEGGRVQRFRQGFTVLPPMRELGAIWDEAPDRARLLVEEVGFVLAAELRACGLDLSFAPVLDLDHGRSSVIGNRAFHGDPEVVAVLAQRLVQGMKRAGMGAVGKHFPGHGHVRADSHLEVPVDERSFADIELADLVPFERLIRNGLPGIMPAHVIYPAVDEAPAGFSAVWLKQVLRGRLGFGGAIFSDDLSMEGARTAGGIVGRARAAFAAGGDMALVCNRPDLVDELLAELDYAMPATSLARIAHMHGRGGIFTARRLHDDPQYQRAVRAVASIGMRDGDLPLFG